VSPTAIIQLALGLIRFVNWLTTQISQSEWERSGYQKAVLDELAVIQKRAALAGQALDDAKKATDADLDKRLGEGQ
jgi:hypothetical protein